MESKFEQELKKLKFKKVWFEDKSSFWFVKNINFCDIKLQLYVETDNKLLLLQVKTGDYFTNKLTVNDYYDPIAKYKLTLENIYMLIKKYK